MKMFTKSWIAVYIASTIAFFFLIWQISLHYSLLQLFGGMTVIATGVVLIYIFFKKKDFDKDDFQLAEEYAEKYVEKKTRTNTTYIESKGTTKMFGKEELFAFQMNRKEGMRPIPFLVIVEKKGSGFKIFDIDEHPDPEVLDDFFGKNPTWSRVIGNPRIAKMVGAPVQINEELYRKASLPSMVTVNTRSDKDKEELGLKE